MNAANAEITGSSGGTIDVQGKWDVVASANGSPLLQLDQQDGQRSEFKLDEQEGKVYLNGERWFRTVTGDHAPDCGSK